jgi:3-deoxy-manno-octulosonate cytidylyltransferase (CMP-KDO synthetase)
VIPARYGSTRLPGKPLEDIGGRPMIEWVHGQAVRSGASEVIVATDDARIVAACERFGARAELTSTDHESGTDRIAELARRLEWDNGRIVVNVQGDEPFLPPGLIRQTADLLAASPQAAIATLATPIESEAELRDPNNAKVVTDRHGWALYFSRAPIPWPRDAAFAGAQRHIGLYGYRVGDLKAITAAAPCALERAERLEQLRALWLGYRIIVATAAELPPPPVDTEHDLGIARRFAVRLRDASGR